MSKGRWSNKVAGGALVATGLLGGASCSGRADEIVEKIERAADNSDAANIFMEEVKKAIEYSFNKNPQLRYSYDLENREEAAQKLEDTVEALKAAYARLPAEKQKEITLAMATFRARLEGPQGHEIAGALDHSMVLYPFAAKEVLDKRSVTIATSVIDDIEKGLNLPPTLPSGTFVNEHRQGGRPGGTKDLHR